MLMSHVIYASATSEAQESSLEKRIDFGYSSQMLSDQLRSQTAVNKGPKSLLSLATKVSNCATSASDRFTLLSLACDNVVKCNVTKQIT